ncbi:MAG: DUF5683 domain-containing protein [Flavisolibacter sp.]
MTNSNVHKIRFVLFILFLLRASIGFCQVDSTKNPTNFDTTKPRIAVDSLPKIDSPVVAKVNKVDSVMLHHSPKKAAIRSALIPGWGQFYNKKYWKIPIVYGALGVSAGVFVFNLQSYRDFRFAYKARIEATTKRIDPVTGQQTLPPDSTNYNKLQQIYKVLDVNAIRNYRDEYRRDIDYSVLVFVLLWGLNVVDATVDAHLKAFDVSPDLSFNFKFGHSQMAGTNGISLVLAFK